MAFDLRSTWRPARVITNRPVANGSMWIALAATDEGPAAFHPGHVLGLGMKLDDHTLIRHAYTVSRGEPTARRFEHLYRVVSGGRMSPLLAQLSPADTVYFHGPFHTPIQQEIDSEARHILLISTGAGIGPLFGYAEKALTDGEARPMTLYAGFREESHACLRPELSELATRHPNFSWQFTLTRASKTWNGLTGRVTEVIPDRIDQNDLESYHFHLVGNGEMVHLLRTALYRAGVPIGRVSIETYFNHHATPSDEAVDQLARQFHAE
jgi:NAD(P)H-flavin reductase